MNCYTRATLHTCYSLAVGCKLFSTLFIGKTFKIVTNHCLQSVVLQASEDFSVGSRKFALTRLEEFLALCWNTVLLFIDLTPVHRRMRWSLHSRIKRSQKKKVLLTLNKEYTLTEVTYREFPGSGSCPWHCTQYHFATAFIRFVGELFERHIYTMHSCTAAVCILCSSGIDQIRKNIVICAAAASQAQHLGFPIVPVVFHRY